MGIGEGPDLVSEGGGGGQSGAAHLLVDDIVGAVPVCRIASIPFWTRPHWAKTAGGTMSRTTRITTRAHNSLLLTINISLKKSAKLENKSELIFHRSLFRPRINKTTVPLTRTP
jgi:hypothetical protein